MPKMHKNAFGGRVLPGPAGGAYALLHTLEPQWGPVSNGREMEEKGPTSRKLGRRGWKGGGEIPHPGQDE